MATPPPATPLIPPQIATLTGPLFLGHLFNWGLFGALTVQVYMYYIAFPKDKPLPKTIVATVYTLELLQIILSTRDAFRNFGTGWGNMADLDAVGWLWFSVPVLGALICCMGQLFYAWRIWILGRQPVIVTAVITVAVIQLGFGVYAGAAAQIIGYFSKLQDQTFKTTAVWLGSAAINDIIIATCMMYYLNRSNTGFKQTSTLLSKFIRLTLETGLLCATFAILDLSFYCAFQTNNYHLAPSIPLSKLYSNSLLVVLNARIKINGGRDGSGNNGTGTGTISYFDATRDTNLTSRNRTRHRSVPPGAISVSIAHETRIDHTVHIPMEDVKDGDMAGVDALRYDGTPLDVSAEEVDRINKGAHLV